MILRTLVVGPLQTNCYLLGCERTRLAAVIDPGGDAEVIISTVEREDLNVLFIINTHGHFDHTAAN